MSLDQLIKKFEELMHEARGRESEVDIHLDVAAAKEILIYLTELRNTRASWRGSTQGADPNTAWEEMNRRARDWFSSEHFRNSFFSEEKFRQYEQRAYERAFNWGNQSNRAQDPPPKANAKRHWWEILEVDVKATKSQIEKAFRRKMMAAHPDRLGPKATDAQRKAAAQRAAELNTARAEALGGL